METFRFIAENAAAALAQIHSQLGPDAVVLDVRQRPARGMAKLWPHSRGVEVLAGVPETISTLTRPSDTFSHPMGEGWGEGVSAKFTNVSFNRWQTVAWLEAMGLLPEFAKQLQAHLDAAWPASPPPALEDQWAATCVALASFWREAPPLSADGPVRPHLFIGPPGTGKTTALCKWLTLAVLTEEKRARVWRLDSNTANTAEFLDIHCEMLNVPVERFWSGPIAGVPPDLSFADLPGVELTDTEAMAVLRSRITSLPSPRIHLVLNGAYETGALFEQWRAFAALEPEDVIFTHLDEEPRRVKLWNFVFGTNCSLRFLCAGQKIPGEFLSAAPELLFPSQIAR